MPFRSFETLHRGAFLPLEDYLINMNATGAQPGLFRLEKSTDAMGSTCSIVLYDRDQAKMEAAISAAFDEVRRIDTMLSIYRSVSEWSEINRNAAQRPIPVSSEVFQLLCRCLEYSRRSEGAFDISVGPLIKTWGFFKGTGRLPSQAEVSGALSNVGYQRIHLDPVARTVRFDCPGMEIDPGGIGKGYAIDCIVILLRRLGFKTALVAASGSSIYGMGTPPTSAKGWQVDIRDPRHPGETAAEVLLKDMSVSTSGCYERTYWAEGRTYSHIMDPRTGYPAQGMSLVSVIAPQTTDSEAWTKPCFINGYCWAAKHAPKELSAFFCEGGSGERGRWIRGSSRT